MDINDKLIVTIAIQMHGIVFTHELTNNSLRAFENVRLLCGAGGFNTYETNFLNESIMFRTLRNFFAHDIDEKSSTFDMLKESRKGLLFGNVTYDKILSTTIANSGLFGYMNPITYVEGIYLITIHRGKKLIYPTISNDIINLIYVDQLKKLADLFAKQIPDIQRSSSEFPNVTKYFDEENNLRKKKDITEDVKLAKIEDNRKQLYDILNTWNLMLNSSQKKIEMIKLSFLVELIKKLISDDCILNLLDYSCNNTSSYIPQDQQHNIQYAMKYDIEQGIPNTKLGGKKYRRKSYRKKKRRIQKSCKNKKRTKPSR
jgi:hypothetical protein